MQCPACLEASCLTLSCCRSAGSCLPVSLRWLPCRGIRGSYWLSVLAAEQPSLRGCTFGYKGREFSLWRLARVNPCTQGRQRATYLLGCGLRGVDIPADRFRRLVSDLHYGGGRSTQNLQGTSRPSAFCLDACSLRRRPEGCRHRAAGPFPFSTFAVRVFLR